LRWVVLKVYKGVVSRKAREKEKEREREDASNNYVRGRGRHKYPGTRVWEIHEIQPYFLAG